MRKTEKFTIKDRWGEDLSIVKIEIVKDASDGDKLGRAVLVAIEENANLSYANLRSANLSYANLRSANLSYANLRSANLSSADLSYANLRSANLSSADLSSADLSYANLRSANLSYANLRSANLSSANLRSANLSSADLSSADLSSADLSSADLSSADLSYANLLTITIWNTIGNREEIKSMQIETYGVSYTSEILQIGCEQHKIEEWKEFDDKRILEMDGKDALRFWQKFKDLIFQTIEISPAVKSEYVEKEADASN